MIDENDVEEHVLTLREPPTWNSDFRLHLPVLRTIEKFEPVRSPLKLPLVHLVIIVCIDRLPGTTIPVQVYNHVLAVHFETILTESHRAMQKPARNGQLY